MRTLLATAAVLATLTSADAQQYQVCTTTSCSGGVCTSICTPYNVPPIRRNYQEQQQRSFDETYQQRAYEYELQLLEQENRRR